MPMTNPSFSYSFLSQGAVIMEVAVVQTMLGLIERSC